MSRPPKKTHLPAIAAEVDAFLATKSSFAFELKVLNALVALGLKCEHGGTYDDPVTHKPRQFDIRARHVAGNLTLSLAVECKALSSIEPLLVLCVPRIDGESFHSVAVSHSPFSPNVSGHGWASVTIKADQKHAHCVCLYRLDSIYEPKQPVGKSTVHLRRNDDGTFDGDDKEVYERWAQAISSSQDIVDYATESKPPMLTFVCPVLVVPDGTLWSASYHTNGLNNGTAAPAERVSFFVGRNIYPSDRFRVVNHYPISHLEIVTLNGLKQMVCAWMSESGLEAIFPVDTIRQRLADQYAEADAKGEAE